MLVKICGVGSYSTSFPVQGGGLPIIFTFPNPPIDQLAPFIDPNTPLMPDGILGTTTG